MTDITLTVFVRGMSERICVSRLFVVASALTHAFFRTALRTRRLGYGSPFRHIVAEGLELLALVVITSRALLVAGAAFGGAGCLTVGIFDHRMSQMLYRLGYGLGTYRAGLRLRSLVNTGSLESYHPI